MRRPKPVEDGETLRFASYNVHKCIGIDQRFDPERTRAVIAEIDPDVIALQEADRRFGDRMGLLDLAALERETGLVPVPLRERRRLGHGWHGNLLLVKSGAVRHVHQMNLPGLEPRGAVLADIELRHGHVRVLAAHLGLLRQSRMAQVRTITGLLPHDPEIPVVLLGDMNEWRAQGRTSLGLFAPGFGPVNRGVPSFPSYFPVLALDRILARPHHILERVERHDSPLARQASDHLPVKARVRLDGTKAEAAATAPADEPKVRQRERAGRAGLRLTDEGRAILRRLRRP
jgi:endonuclease/exonuclease/phosphatase family metal-dependent hydrolase